MRLLIPTLLVVLATIAACGPREGQASNSRPNDADPSTTRRSDTSVITAVESAVPSEPASARRPIHPTAAAAAKKHMDGLIAKRKVLESTLNMVWSILARHESRYGEPWSPDPDPTRPWGALIGRTLDAAPVNPFSPAGVATHIVMIELPGAGGETVSPKTAGWVWNKADRTLDAARDSAAVRASEREQRRRVIATTYGPHLMSTLRTLRGQIALYTLYETPLWILGEVASQQWAPLVDSGYIFDTPDNPLSPREVAGLIVEVAVQGADGASVSPLVAGWVWNSTDRMLFAAGYRED